MTNQEEHTIVAQWISPTKDSVFISKDLLYYGRVDSLKNNEIPGRENLQK